MEVKIAYEQVGGFEFAQVIQKIAAVPTTTAAANHIRRVINEIEAARKQISAEYKTEIMEKYGKRNEAGELARPEGDTQGFDPDETKMDEFIEAQKEFGKRTATIKWRPLTPKTLNDVKLSAKELNLLGPLFSEDEGPGLPESFPFPAPTPNSNVTPLRQ